MGRFDVSVVIPTLNRSDIVWGLVEYLRGQLRWHHPIILNDQSDDHGAALRSRLKASGLENVKVRVDGGIGTGRGRNRGALEAESEWLLFMDDDVIPLPSYLEEMAAFIEENPWIDAAEGRIVGSQLDWDAYRANPDAWMRRWEKQEGPGRRLRPPYVDGVNWLTSSARAPYPTSTIGICSCNLVIRRDVFLAVGGFDANIQGLGDDREIGVRLWWYGYRTQQCPTAHIFQLHHPVGGTRDGVSDCSSSRKKVRGIPKLDSGLLYFYMKWFPGLPTKQMILSHVLSGIRRRPWTLPALLRSVVQAYRCARQLQANGPQYVTDTDPIPRAELMVRKVEANTGAASGLAKGHEHLPGKVLL